jgi:hypothetical protein
MESQEDFCIDDVDILLNWGGDMDNYDNVPSVIAYMHGDQNIELASTEWGRNISPDSLIIRNARIGLEPRDTNLPSDSYTTVQREYLDSVLARAGKSAEQVVADYLGKVFSHFIQQCYLWPCMFAELDIDLIITAPSVRKQAR